MVNKDIKISSNRSFGLVFFVLFLIIGLWPLINNNEIKIWSIAISVVFLVLGLLNSKLLYVNRIFKANSLNDGQKLRVVESLDKAGSVKEAKLIYETIKDTFTIKQNNTKLTPKRKTIKENFGMASKAAGKSTAPKRVITETDNMVARMQKLANISKINQ